MCEEVEAHALYEKSTALARASGSRRLPKVRLSASSSTGWALATQQSIPLHQLMLQQRSNAASSAEELAVPPQNDKLLSAQSGNVAAVHREVKDMARIPNKHLMHTPQVYTELQMQHEQQQQQQHPSLLGREAQLLSAPYKPPPADNAVESPSERVKRKHAKPAAAELGVAVVFEEKYHRAGREVLGQRADAAAAALAVHEHTKRRAETQKKQLGYTPLKLEAAPREHAITLSRESPLGAQMAAPRGFQYAFAI